MCRSRSARRTRASASTHRVSNGLRHDRQALFLRADDEPHVSGRTLKKSTLAPGRRSASSIRIRLTSAATYRATTAPRRRRSKPTGSRSSDCVRARVHAVFDPFAAPSANDRHFAELPLTTSEECTRADLQRPWPSTRSADRAIVRRSRAHEVVDEGKLLNDRRGQDERIKIGSPDIARLTLFIASTNGTQASMICCIALAA